MSRQLYEKCVYNAQFGELVEYSCGFYSLDASWRVLQLVECSIIPCDLLPILSFFETIATGELSDPLLLTSPCRTSCKELMKSDRLWVNSLKSTKPADNSLSRWSVKLRLVWETLLNPVGRWCFSRHVYRDSALFSTKYKAIALNWDVMISGGQGCPPRLSLLRQMCNSCSCSV